MGSNPTLSANYLFYWGAAGFYRLTWPGMSNNLLQDKIASIRTQPPDPCHHDTGCALLLPAGIRKAGLEVEVRHPVQVLSESQGEVTNFE